MRLGLVRLGFLALLALDGGALAAQSTHFAYAPGRARYRLTTTVHRDQIQGGGRAPFEFNVTTTQFVTVDLAPQSRDTLRLTITLDSVDVTSDLAAPQPDLHRLFGRKVTGLISPQGRIYQFDPPPSDSAEKDTRDLYNSFRRFLVQLPAEPLKVGTSWVDTTTEKVRRNGFDVLARAITSSRVAGDTVVGGQHVWRIARRAELTQEGEAKEAGKTIHLTGEGSVTGTHLVSHDGRYVGSESTQRFDITMTMSGSESAPISQTIKSKVERLTKS
ncbi:MAG TPA: hypothetical protein VF041_18035 [Gemmatimonadaceae bacterium]